MGLNRLNTEKDVITFGNTNIQITRLLMKDRDEHAQNHYGAAIFETYHFFGNIR